MKLPSFATVRKLAVYVVAIGAAIPTSIVLPSPWDVVVPAVIAIAGAVIHYQVPNAPVPVVFQPPQAPTGGVPRQEPLL